MTLRNYKHPCGCVTTSDDTSGRRFISCKACQTHKDDDLAAKLKLTRHQKRFHPGWGGMNFGKGSGTMELKVRAVVHVNASVLEEKPGEPGKILNQVPNIETHMEVIEEHAGQPPRIILLRGPTPFKAGQVLKLEVTADMPEPLPLPPEQQKESAPEVAIGAPADGMVEAEKRIEAERAQAQANEKADEEIAKEENVARRKKERAG